MPNRVEPELNPGQKAGTLRKGVRTRLELVAQADRLRHAAISLDQYVDELKSKKITKFEMDGHTKFDRAEALLTDYLVQVNRWIGNHEHGR